MPHRNLATMRPQPKSFIDNQKENAKLFTFFSWNTMCKMSCWTLENHGCEFMECNSSVFMDIDQLLILSKQMRALRSRSLIFREHVWRHIWSDQHFFCLKSMLIQNKSLGFAIPSFLAIFIFFILPQTSQVIAVIYDLWVGLSVSSCHLDECHISASHLTSPSKI